MADEPNKSQEQILAALKEQTEAMRELTDILKGMSLDLRDVLIQLEDSNSSQGGGLA